MSATVERPKRSREEDADGPSGPSPPKRARLDEQVPLSEETNGAPSANLDPVTPTEPAPGCAMASLTTEEPSLNVSEVPRSQEFWFADGDMILWVENAPNKAETILFRVHRDALAKCKLEPFCTANEFAIPKEGTPGEVFLDGLWVSKYEQQNPEDITAILTWIYLRPGTLKQDPVSMHFVKLLLERARMHDYEPLRRCAIEYLWNMFPTSLNYHHKVPCFVADCYAEDPALLYEPSLLYDAIQLSDEYKIVTILPMVYYYIAQWPIEWITEGLPSSEMIDVARYNQKKRYKMSATHVIRILRGRTLLTEARRDRVFSFLDQFTTGTKLENPTAGCPLTEDESGDTCFDWLMRVHMYLSRQKVFDRPNALEIMNAAQWVAFRKHLCNPCAQRVLKHILRGRDEVWMHVPGWFNCKSWEEVLEDQNLIEATLVADIM